MNSRLVSSLDRRKSRSAAWLAALLYMLYLGAIAMALVTPAQAQSQTEGEAKAQVEVLVTAPYIDIHTGPGRGYPVFHVAEKDETLILLKRRTDWYKVATTDGKQGWVKRAALDNTLAPDGAQLDFSVPRWQGYRDKRWELGVQGGRFSGTEAVNVHLGLRMTPHLSTEVRYAQAFGNFSDNKLATLNIVHRPFPEWRFTPFVTLGVGAIKTSPQAALVETEDRHDNLLTAGGGAVFYMSQRFALRLEYSHYLTLTTRDNNEEVEEWKAGFSVSF